MGRVTRGLTMLYLTTILMGVGHGMLFPVIPLIAGAFDVHGGVAAQTVTAFAAGRLVGQPLGGVLIDRFGTRLTVTFGPVVIALAVFAGVVTPWLWPLLVALFIAGAADSGWMLGREVAGVDLVKPEQRGRLMSGFMGFNSVGMGLGALAGGFMGDEIGFRPVFVIYTGLAVAVFLLGLFIPNTQGPNAGPQRSAAPAGQPREAWHIRLKGLFLQIDPALRATYLTLVFATMAMMLYRMAYQGILPVYADEIGMSSREIGVLFSIMTAGSLVMILPAGFVVDKVGRKWATVPSTAIPGIAFLLIPMTDGFGALAAIAVLMGFSNGLSLGSVATSTYDVVPDAARARLQAARRTFAEVGAIGGPALGGILAVGYGAGLAFLVYAPVLLVAAALLLFVARETLVKRPNPAAASAA